jgi:hypothetical protein
MPTELDMIVSAPPSREKRPGWTFAGAAGVAHNHFVGRAGNQFGAEGIGELSVRCQKTVTSLLRRVAAYGGDHFDQAMDFLNSRRRILPDAVLGTASTK